MSSGKGEPIQIPVPSQDNDGKKKDEQEDKKDPVTKDGKAPKKEVKNEMSEEDQLIKSSVELYVTRIQESNSTLAATALESLGEKLKQASGAVGSIPKPLKFVRPHFEALEKAFATMDHDANKKKLSDILSMIAMSLESKETPRRSLKYKLTGSHDDLASWGHEYLRHLAGEIAAEWNALQDEEQPVDHLLPLVHQVVTFMMTHSDEPAAIDLALEIDEVPKIVEYCNEDNFVRVANYLLAVARYVPHPEDDAMLTVIYDIYSKVKSYTNSMRIALALKDQEKVQTIFAACESDKIKIQLALMCGRFKCFVELEDDNLNEIVGNTKLSELYQYTARDLDSMAPKAPEDIYKSHLMDQKQLPTTANSHVQNLASTFVNAFANTGFGTDKLMTVEGSNWIFQTKEHRMMSATASLGLIHMWDHEMGLQATDKYMYSEENHIKAGALLASGLLMCGVRSPFDPLLGIAAEHVNGTNRDVRLGAILGLGFGYSGTNREDIKELLSPLIADSTQPVEIQCFAAYALALVYAGSCEEDISEATVMCIMDKTEDQLMEPCMRYLILALGALFLGKQEAAETLLDTTKALDPLIQKYTEVVVLSCAYAATGSVTTVQKLFQFVAEAPEEKEEEKKEGEKKPEAAAEGDEKPEEKKEDDKKKPLNYKAAAILGIGLVSLGEDLGVEMCKRVILHPLLAKAEESDTNGRRGVPLALALLSISNPNLGIIETLSKLSHDADACTAQSAILGLGLVAAGTNNARVATMLRNLAGYYHKDKDSNFLFLVRIAQGLVCLGKGHITLAPSQSDHLLTSPTALIGLLGLCHSGLDMEKTILDKYHYMLYSVVPAMSPRMLLTVDEDLTPVTSEVRVGMAVDTVAQPGKPKSITGFQTHNTPVLLPEVERAEMATGKFKPCEKHMILEGIIVVEDKDKKLTAE